HRVPRLAVALRVRHPEAPARALVDVASLLLTDQDDRAVPELAETGDHRAVVAERPVAVQLEPVVEQPLDVVERVRPVVVAGQLDLAPDLLVSGLLADPGDLPLEPLELAGDARAAEQRQVPQPPEPLAQPQLVLSRRHCRASGDGTASDAARSAARRRRSGRRAGPARPGRTPRAASRACSPARRA